MSVPELTPIDPESIPEVPDNGERKRKAPRAPRGTAKPRQTAADKRNIETALASMQTLYSSATAGLLLLRRPESAEYLASQIEQLQAGNRQAFEASPKLASVISSIGQFSAIGLFISTNVTVLGMTAMAMRMEKAAQVQQQDGQA